MGEKRRRCLVRGLLLLRTVVLFLFLFLCLRLRKKCGSAVLRYRIDSHAGLRPRQRQTDTTQGRIFPATSRVVACPQVWVNLCHVRSMIDGKLESLQATVRPTRSYNAAKFCLRTEELFTSLEFIWRMHLTASRHGFATTATKHPGPSCPSPALASSLAFEIWV